MEVREDSGFTELVVISTPKWRTQQVGVWVMGSVSNVDSEADFKDFQIEMPCQQEV